MFSQCDRCLLFILFISKSFVGMCTSAYNDCTEVDGSLVLFLEPGSDKDEENAITRTLETINNAMTSDYLALRVSNLLKASYLGPIIQKPQKNSVTEVKGFPPQTRNSNRSGLTTSGLLVATLVSTMVGFFAAFVLFKKINNRQNCMAACDGSGIDQGFMESQTRPVPVLPLSPNGDIPFDDEEDDDDDGEMQMLHYDLANGGLSAIAETLDMSSSDAESSYASSFAMSAMTNQTNMTRSLADGSNWNDSESISSERTTRTSNRALVGGRARVLSTPHFGTKDNNLRII